MRRRHSSGRVHVQPYTSEPLGRRDIPGGSVPSAAPSEGSPAITVPYRIEEFMGSKGEGGEAAGPRRMLQAAPEQVCRSRANVTFGGGGLANNTLILRGIKSAAACCGHCYTIPNCFAWTWSQRTKFCYPKHATGWVEAPKRGVISGQVDLSLAPAASPSPPPPSPPPPRPPPLAAANPWWEPRLTVGDNQLTEGFAVDIQTVQKANNKVVVTDPTGNSSEPVIKTTYDKGSWAPAAGLGGGALFYAWPYGKAIGIGEAARLEYEVYFEPGFPWVKGGKLPGLVGGGTHCSGGQSAENCFSVRLMWRREGYGEAYLYVPHEQDPIFCTTQGTVCDYQAGISLNRGAFQFESGRWMQIAITVVMNDVGKTNGLIQVDIDGSTRIHYDKLVWRKRSTLEIDAFFFATWFGGGDASWAPPTTVESYWRNIKIYKLA